MTYLDVVEVHEGDSSRNVVEWSGQHADLLRDSLSRSGAIMLRGFAAPSEETVEEVLRVFSEELLEDAFWSTPRSAVQGKTFTATEYPGPRTILLHSEMAYMNTFPRLLAFHSIKAAEEGGQTTIADLNAVSRALADVLPRFAKGVTYQRYYHPGVDIPWQQAFRTGDKGELSKIGKRVHMELAWVDGESLRTTHTAQGVVKDEDGTPIWFNQAHLFHASNLPSKDRETLSGLFGADRLPRNAYFADGSSIPDDVVTHVQAVLAQHTIPVEWRAGDVLVIDNMRFMHGRMPYAGTRRLHVAMAQSHGRPVRDGLFAKPKAKGLWGRLVGG